MYSEAADKYKRTIGYTNPSYVIEKFLDMKRIDSLVIYLEALVKESRKCKYNFVEENQDLIDNYTQYATLLLNCYVKQGGEKLKDSLLQGGFDPNLLDTNAIIDIYKDSKEYEHALQIAQKAKDIDQELRIMIEDMKDYKGALERIKGKMSFDSRVKYIRRFGSELLKELPEKTYGEIEKLAKEIFELLEKKPSSEKANKLNKQLKALKEVLVDNKEMSKRFLLFQAAEDSKCGQEVYHSLIEWHLQDYVDSLRPHKDKMKEEKMISNISIGDKQKALIKLLLDTKDKYDQKHVLMLCEMYQVSEGIQVICKLLELKHELMEYYMNAKDYASIISLCKEHGEAEGKLWIQALTFFVSELQEDALNQDLPKYIRDVLNDIGNMRSISPLLVLDILSKCDNLKLSIIKEYVGNKLGKLQKKVEKNRSEVIEIEKEIEGLKKDVDSLRTTAQVFHLKECAECGNSRFDSQIIHFMCNHTYDEHCVSSAESEAAECPKCSIYNAQVIDKRKQLLAQRNNNEQFFKELRASDVKLDVISQYYGRGLFTGLKPPIKMEKKEEEEEEEDDDTLVMIRKSEYSKDN